MVLHDVNGRSWSGDAMQLGLGLWAACGRRAAVLVVVITARDCADVVMEATSGDMLTMLVLDSVMPVPVVLKTDSG